MTPDVLLPRPDPTCPYLGLTDDPETHFAFPSTAQRCHASARPASIDHAKQARDCLTAQHVGCSRYRPPAVTPAPGGRLRGAVAATSVERVRSVRDEGQVAPPAGRLRHARKITGLALIIGVAVVGTLLGSGVGTLSGFRSNATPSPDARGAPVIVDPGTPSVAPSRTPPSATPAASQAATPAASQAATPAASQAATPAPTSALATPTAAASPQVYVVQRGDTLLGIADTFGLALADLVRANDIKDPDSIVVGQRLDIPRP